MSETKSYPKAEFFRKPNLSEYLPNVPKCRLNTQHDNREVTWSDTYSLFPKAEFARICPNIYRMFRSVDSTQDMIIVKWHLFIWHVRKLCALTYAPPVQSTEAGLWLSTLFHVNFHANCSAAQVYVLHPRQFIFALSCRGLSFLQVLQSTSWALRVLFVYLMMTNVMMKTCLNQKIIKISNLIQAMKSSACPKPKVIRRPNFSEIRICPNIYRMFRSVDWTHDMIIVNWHLFHLTGAQTLCSDKCATGSIHANGSMTINVIPC